MGDSTLTDADKYADLLKGKTEGRPFYFPRAEGVIGDCGIIKDGRFVKLFNCFVDGIGGEVLPTSVPDPGRIPTISDLADGPEEIASSERSLHILSNEGVSWCVHEGKDWSVGLGVSTPLNAGFGFKASHTSGAAAFLVPGGSARRVELLLQDIFKPYLSRYHRAIQTDFSAYKTRTIYMIEGTTHGTSWCRGLARKHGREVEGFVNISLIAGLPQAEVSISRGGFMDHPWNNQSGPLHQPSNGRLQLISAKVTTIRTNFVNKIISTLSSATIPTRHSPSQNAGGRHGSGTTSRASHIIHDSASGLSGTSSGSSHRLSATFGDNAQLVASEVDMFRTDDRSEVHGGLSPVDTSAPSSLTDMSTIDYTPDPSNEVERLLDASLEAHPQFQAMIVGWAVLEAFWRDLGKDTQYKIEDLRFHVNELEGGDDGRVAQICQISPPSSTFKFEPVENSTTVKPYDAKYAVTAANDNKDIIDWITPLYEYYHRSAVTISWSEPTQIGSMWTISVFINEVMYSSGIGRNIKMAKHDAARQAIEFHKEVRDINIVVR